MPSIIPFTWHQQRTTNTTGANPGPGQWYTDTTDPEYNPGVLYVKRTTPFWTALQHGYPTTGGCLALVAGPTDDGQHAFLRLYYSDDAGTDTEPQFTESGYTEIEPRGCMAAGLGIRGSVIDVIYIQDAQFKHVYSTDGGRSFSEPEVFSLTSAAGAPLVPRWWTIGGSATNVGITTAGHLRLGYAADRSLRLLVPSYAADGTSPAQYILTGNPRADNRWDWGKAGWFDNLNPTVLLSPVPALTNVHVTRDGRVILLPTTQRVEALAEDGTYQLLGTDVTASQTVFRGHTSGLNPRMGEMLTLRQPGGGFGSDANGFYNTREWTLWRWDAGGSTYVRQGSSSGTDIQLAGWLYASANSFITVPAGNVLVRRDGTWEYFYLARSGPSDPTNGVLTIKRCYRMPPTSTDAIWE